MTPKTKVEHKVEHAKENNRLLRWVSRIGFTVIIIAAIFSFWYFYQVFFPQKITTIEQEDRNIPVQVDKEVVKAGETISWMVDYCKNKDVPSTLAIGFVDGTLASTFNAIAHFPVGCRQGSYTITVPVGLRPDDYHIEVTLTYRGGFLRDEIHNFRTERFRVVE